MIRMEGRVGEREHNLHLFFFRCGILFFSAHTNSLSLSLSLLCFGGGGVEGWAGGRL